MLNCEGCQECKGFLKSNTVSGDRNIFEKTHTNLTRVTKLLHKYKEKQQFRVAMGKSRWVNYDNYNKPYNLREILKDEIVIEFDTEDRDKAWKGINTTAINLYGAGITFEIWEHGGKSPHLHIHNLPIPQDFDKTKRREFKKFFIRRFVPKEYLDCVDFSLCGMHLIALEWTNHWKGKYGVKRLLHVFNPTEVKQ